VNATATTDGNGYYEFTGLRPGSYTVTETTQPPTSSTARTPPAIRAAAPPATK
jgi:protocatechuate 3,4-dioxygenase beta subunit